VLLWLTLSYGSLLVDVDVLSQPGVIFTCVAGIGSSTYQLAGSWKRVCRFHDKVRPKSGGPSPPTLEDGPGYIPAITFTHDLTPRDVEGSSLSTPSRWRHKLSELARKWPSWTLLMTLACIVHSFAWPAFTRLTGYYFNAYKPIKLTNDAAATTLFYTNLEKWNCTSYAIMGIVVYVGSLSMVMSYTVLVLVYNTAAKFRLRARRGSSFQHLL